MSFSQQIKQGCTKNGVELMIESTYTAGAGAPLSEAVPAGSTDREMAWACPVTGLKTLMIKAKDAALVIKVNSSSAPDKTISLGAGKGLVWAHDCPYGCPFSTAVTKLYVSNAEEVDGTLEIEALYDPTP